MMARPSVFVVCLTLSIFVTLGQVWRMTSVSSDRFRRQAETSTQFRRTSAHLIVAKTERYLLRGFTSSHREVLRDIVAVNNSDVDVAMSNGSNKTLYSNTRVLVNTSNTKSLYSNPRVLRAPEEILQILQNVETSKWTFNDSAINALRSQMENVTRTSEQFILTQQNAPLNATVRFADQNGNFVITKRLFNAEQETSPLSNKTFETCSLVGNSGLLKGSGCGREIDRADFVIRFNMPSVLSQWREDIGARTHLVTTNVHTIQNKFQLYGRNWIQAFRNFIRNCNLLSTYILTFPFNGRGNGDFFLSFQEKLKASGVGNKVLMNHPHHRRHVAEFWANKGLKEPTLTSGFYVVSAALAFCKHIRVFGFWPFLTDRHGSELQYHFKLNYLHRDGGLSNTFHRMDREFFKLVELYRDGIIELVTDKCR